MTYTTEQKKLIRRKIDLVILKLDYCDLTYGTAPCTATESVKCYNTFFTCKDKTNYDKTTKEYKFISSDLPASVAADYYPARPYIKNLSSLSTEILENDTVVKRLKVELFDEVDNTDVGIDPYRDSRAQIRGNFLKKLIARNKNYKGRIIELHEGFEGMDIADFQMKFAGRIENFTVENGYGVIEAVDLLKKLSEIEYPLKTDIYIEDDLPMMWIAQSETEMTELTAELFDQCWRKDFQLAGMSTPTAVTDGSGTLDSATYYQYSIVVYDTNGRPFARNSALYLQVTPGGSNNAFDLSWSTVTGATTYRIFRHNITTRETYYHDISAPTTTYRDLGGGTAGVIPTEAERYFYLAEADPTDASNWTAITSELTIGLNDGSPLDGTGYVKIDKEIIQYTKSGNTLLHLQRGRFSTDISEHSANTIVHAMFEKAADNPFTHLKDMLALAGIDSAYIDTKFTTYESAWSGIDFSTNVIVKETKLNKIYFDLINAVDCISWVGEDGKIKIQYKDEIPATYKKVTKETSFLEGSVTVDQNDESRKTRWLQYWNRFDVEKGLDDKQAYNRIEILIDADAEAANEYDDEKEDVQFTTWLNTDSDTVASITTYLTDLLEKRQARTRNAQEFVEAYLELKDGDILIGEVVLISTDKLQDIHGNNFNNVAFRLIKKTPENNRIRVKFKRVFSKDGFLLQANGDKILQADDSAIKISIWG